MITRHATDDERQFAWWTLERAPAPVARPRVLIAHTDRPIGESLAVVLRLKGLQVMIAHDLKTVRSLVANWKPEALLLDTRLDSDTGYRLIRQLRVDVGNTCRLLVAISNIAPADPVESLKDAGFDAHCRRPCATWRVAGLLESYFSNH
jgi:DNA-binding response OmpR family regulator